MTNSWIQQHEFSTICHVLPLELQNTIIPNINRFCDLVVRRTYRREAVVGPYWIYQINAFSAKVSLCPKRFCSDVFVCVSYLAGRESWRLQLLLLPGSVLSEEGIQEDARCGQHHRIGAWVTPGHFTMAVLCCGNHRPPWAAGFTLDGWPDQRKNGQDRKLTYK